MWYSQTCHVCALHGLDSILRELWNIKDRFGFSGNAPICNTDKCFPKAIAILILLLLLSSLLLRMIRDLFQWFIYPTNTNWKSSTILFCFSNYIIQRFLSWSRYPRNICIIQRLFVIHLPEQKKGVGKLLWDKIHVIDAVIKKSLYSHKRENNEDLNTLIVMSHLIYLQWVTKRTHTPQNILNEDVLCFFW